MTLSLNTAPALFTPLGVPALAPTRLAAMPGVQLLPRGGRFLASQRSHGPNAASAFAPFPLPVVPGRLIDGLAELLRTAERRVGCGGAALLHLDPAAGAWSASFPAPQPALAQPAVAELVAAMKRATPPLLIDLAPGDRRLLAGGYLATPTADADALARQVPQIDGLWLFHLAGSWAHAGAFARAAGRLFVLNILDVVSDLDASGELHANDRPWVPCPA